MQPNFANHYNHCMQTFEDLEEMFTWLDLYRKTGDKRNLYASKDYESKIRTALKKIKADNNQLVNPEKKAA
jgi:hypothetical protein